MTKKAKEDLSWCTISKENVDAVEHDLLTHGYALTKRTPDGFVRVPWPHVLKTKEDVDHD